MKKYFLALSVLYSSFSLAQMIYPETPQEEAVDNYFDTKVVDLYQWLEQDTADRVKHWVLSQQKTTEAYFRELRSNEKIKIRLEQLMNYEKVSIPMVRGNQVYYFKNSGLKNQSVLYTQKSESSQETVFIDPNSFSSDGTVSMSAPVFSKNNRYCVYSLFEAGSDWRTMYIMEVATKKILPETIKYVKSGGVSWDDNGFYYSGYDAPNDTLGLYISKNEFQKVKYHRLNTPQSLDVVEFENKKDPFQSKSVILTDDGRFLILRISKGTSGNKIFCKDLQKSKKGMYKPIFENDSFDYDFIDNQKNRLLFRTNNGASLGHIISVNSENPSDRVTIIPESKNKMEWASHVGAFIFVGYLKDASSYVVQYDRYGVKIREINMPGIGMIDGFGGSSKDSITFYSFSSFIEPAAIYRYNVNTMQSDLYYGTKLNFDKEKYETRLTYYKSADGTQIPIFLTHKRGLVHDGNNPVFLYGYGGFNISMSPRFNPVMLPFLERGGVYAVACIRGGGEYGDSWHQAGMLAKKQNVFDDFISAAEFLISTRYTNPARLAIHGRSNGGLLVGACMTQRPELFKVALPMVGVMDMLRYHQFTIGWAWAVEYGTSESKEQFDYLYKYSPLHNLREQAYPATLILTGDHDDRVVPAHSYKFGATLQRNQLGGAPILLRIDKRTGHGAGKPLQKLIQEWADIYTFTFHHLGM